MLDQNVAEFEKMNINKWHSYGYKGKGAKVVVLDSTHRPYIHTNVVDPFKNNVDKVGHKSQVAQVIREVAPEAEIVVMSWFGAGKQEMVDWIKEHESELCAINCSFNTSVGTDIFEQLEDVDIPIIAASGNNSKDRVGSSADYLWTIAVGAWEERRDKRAHYSNYGEGLDLVAYTNIEITTESTTNTLSFNGTSCAAPVVTALLAIYNGWLNDHGLTKLSRDEAKEFLRQHSIDKLDEGYDFESGHGLAVLPQDIPEIVEVPKPEPIPEEDDTVYFTDTVGRYSEKAIDHVNEKGLMKGYPDGSFQPNKPVSREELAMVIARMTGFVEEKK